MESKMARILIADDEPDIIEIIRYNLSLEGYEIFTARNGEEALTEAAKHRPALVILDIMMPKKDGFEVCNALRSDPAFSDTIIIFLTAINEESSEIRGLESGADDYITKPISPKVLVSKVNALLRRKGRESPSSGQAGELIIDRERYSVRYKDEDIILARKEFELLALLASKPGKVFLRNEILSSVWGNEVIVGDRTIDVHVRKIRQKLASDCITTVKGVGYKFEL